MIEDVKTSEETRRSQLQQEMLARMVGAYEASRVRVPDRPRRDDRMAVVILQARLWLRYRIPFWPPRLLLNKIVRRLVSPVFAPQIQFNEAVRDVLLDMRQDADAQAAAHREAMSLVAELQERVETLSAEIAHLRRSAAAGKPSAAANVTMPAAAEDSAARVTNGAAVS